MNDSKITVRYAKALFDLAVEENTIDRVYENMRAILQVCLMPEIRQVFDNPVITSKKKKEILAALTAGKNESLSDKFIDLVFSRGREHYLASICRYFIDLTRRKRHIRQVTVVTAVPVGQHVKSDIIGVLEKRSGENIELIEQVDQSLIGGFILRIDDRYVDASVRTKLNRFRKAFDLTGKKE